MVIFKCQERMVLLLFIYMDQLLRFHTCNQNSTQRQRLLLLLFCKGGGWGPERLRSLLQVAELEVSLSLRLQQKTDWEFYVPRSGVLWRGTMLNYSLRQPLLPMLRCMHIPSPQMPAFVSIPWYFLVSSISIDSSSLGFPLRSYNQSPPRFCFINNPIFNGNRSSVK